MGIVQLAAARVGEAEGRHVVPSARTPDSGFAITIASWVRGAPLISVLELAGEDGDEMSPGDFVRQAKQVADLCEQVGRLETDGALAQTAQVAREAILRGVVAGASLIPPIPDGPP